MKKILATAALFLLAISMNADEGMWMVNMIDKVLETNMKNAGMKMSGKVIYDEEKGGLTDAVVSLGFACTGSMISKDGLMITNHHCAYSDICALSTPGKNYLEDGFWALRRDEEIPIKNQVVYFLKKVVDVTEDVAAMKADAEKAGKPLKSRKLSYVVEKKYAPEYPGMDVSLYSMYAGQKYYIMVYEVYKDVRLVAAPPVCIGSFGGDVDNWEWPQHKGDFAIYRIYTSPDGKTAEYAKENVPLNPRRYLKISSAGIKEGDFAMTLGYPGVTNRYASSYEVDYIANVEFPLLASLKKERMDIMTKWMDANPVTRLNYSDPFFMLSNVQEINENEAIALKKAKVSKIFQEGREKNVPAALLDSLKRAYAQIESIDRQIKYYQNAGVRCGNMFKVATKCNQSKDSEKTLKTIFSVLDLNLEKELFCLNIKELGHNIDKALMGDDLSLWYDKYTPEEAGEAIWKASVISSAEPWRITKNDPLVKAVMSIKMASLHKQKDNAEKNVGNALHNLKTHFKATLYRNNLAAGIPQYPDANSSMRFSYGNVTDFRPCDAVVRNWYSTHSGILEKYDPDTYIFSLKPELAELYKKGDWGRWADKKDGTLHINFLTTNDITGGNSGSPVVNAKGELIGLAFDGNKEGLAGDIYYDPAKNRTVCVDIRYVLWVLDKYADDKYVLDEILR